jgi:hypothetical protein
MPVYLDLPPNYNTDTIVAKSFVMKTSGSEMMQLATNVDRVGKQHKLPLYMIKGKVVPVLNQLSTKPLRHTGEWRYSSTILDLSTRWR